MGDMDSGNSGSMQSSSTGGGGDDQEYDSRGGGGGGGGAESFPAFFNPAPHYPVAPFDNARLLQLYSLNNGSSMFDHHHHHHYQQQQEGQVNFDSLESANFMAQTTNNSSSNNLEMVWANKLGSIRSSAADDGDTCTTTPGYNTSSNPMSTPQVQLGGLAPPLHSLQGTAGVPSADNSPRCCTQNQNHNAHLDARVDSGAGGGGGGGGGPGRNPKKRSRASRRAPTTVLTTDTSNFRQMVQEFTGIPAPPFSASAFPSRTRLDLFGSIGMGMSMGMGMGMGLGTGMGILPRAGTGGGGGGGGSTNLDPPPSYLLRPFAQKILPHPTPVHPPPPPQQQQLRNSGTSASTTSALADAKAAASSSAAATASNNIFSSSSSSTANGATIPPTFHITQNLLGSPPNPMLAFQSLLQPSSTSPTPDKYPLPLIQQGPRADHLGSKGTGTGPSGTATGPMGESEPPSWAAGLHQGLGLSQVDPGHHHHLPPQQTSGSVNEGVGNFSSVAAADTINSQRSAPINGTSDNHGAVIRGERGMVDSWICSSD